MIEITVNNKIAGAVRYGSGFFTKIIEKAAEETGLNDRKAGLSINIVGKEKILKLNKKFRNKNSATDVLSFPTSANETENAIIELGDIFLCLPFASERARIEKTSLDSEIILLTVHGFLHLLGYDHEKTALERRRMFTLQDKIVNKLTLATK